MMKVLFATTNPAKIGKYAKKLSASNIEMLTLNDLGINIDVEETGTNAVENALIKASAYYGAAGIPTIGMDNCLYVEGLPDSKQPGTHVRRINGRELNDDEVMDYYYDLIHQYGGKLAAKWVYGVVLCDGGEPKKYSWASEEFYLVDKPHKLRRAGYPLDSLSIVPTSGKYFVELANEDTAGEDVDDGVADFIVNYMKGQS